MSTFSTTEIDGKKCTAVPKANNVGGSRLATTTAAEATSTSTSSTSTSTSTSESTTSTTSTLSSTTSISTTFTTSISISTPSVTSTTLPDGPPPINVPAPDTSTGETQETLTSTTSSTSSQSDIPITTSAPSITQTSPPPAPPSIPPPVSPSISPSLDTGVLSTVSSTSALDLTTTTSLSSPSSSTTEQDLGTVTQTNDSLEPAITSSASLDASGSTPVVVGDTATTATATTTGAGQLESSNGGAGLTNSAQNNTSGNAISTQTTVAVAGGVIGGLALISIIAFMLWFWRKRLMKKRRSTLLTPLSTGAAYGGGGGGGGGGEKGPYIINRNSLGPTTIPEKVRAVVGYNYHRLRGRVNSLVTRSPKPSVDLNRGNSQFGPPDTPATRSNSRAGAARNEATTIKGRFADWWERLTEDSYLNWRLRNDSKSGRPKNDKYTSMPNAASSRVKGGQPDFLALLSMDEEQQNQPGPSFNNNNNRVGSNPRRSQSLGNDHFLGSLGLNFDAVTANPFADSNAMSHDSAKVMPLAVSSSDPAPTTNPFSDANAILAPPTTYIQTIRRSRGHSVSAARPPSNNTTGVGSVYRGSSVSVETSDTRRNKFRSDPFDLDRPELLAQSSSTAMRGIGIGLPSMPRPTRVRAESFTSKYSSGVSTGSGSGSGSARNSGSGSGSMGEWSDPGPDVGPAGLGRGRWDGGASEEGVLGRRLQQQQSGGVERGKGGGGSQGSVGKAM